MAPDPTDPALPKDASPWTRRRNVAAVAGLPFDDTADLDDVARGLIARLPDGGRVTDDAGRVVWDLSSFAYVVDAEVPDTVHPSLWRQTQLLAEGGLYEVTAGVYQVRSADLSNIDFIEGDTGVVVVDPLISAEVARAAFDLYARHRGERPVTAVISAASKPSSKPSLSVVHTAPSRRRKLAPALSSPPKQIDPSDNPGANHLKPTGTSLRRRRRLATTRSIRALLTRVLPTAAEAAHCGRCCTK